MDCELTVAQSREYHAETEMMAESTAAVKDDRARATGDLRSVLTFGHGCGVAYLTSCHVAEVECNTQCTDLWRQLTFGLIVAHDMRAFSKVSER